MTRRKGSLDLDGSIELSYSGPLDARGLVRTKEEQLDPASFEYGYKGMLTVNRDEEKLYLLSDHQNSTQEASWKVIGPYDDSALDARVTALEQGGGSDTKTFIAEYNVTTAQEIIAYMDSANEPYAALLIKRGGDYHTATSMLKSNDETVVIRSIGTNAGLPYIFTYTVTNGTWANSTYGLQQSLVSGTNIKTINGESVLGSGDITVSSGSVAWNDVTGKPEFANVATSGSYNDLGDKPTIPEAYDDTEVRNLIAGKVNSADLAPVATSGSYNDLGDKPTIPEAYDDAEVRGLIAAKANSADLATVATSGSYNDLGDKPTIPEVYDDSALAARVTAVENGKANSADLAAVATSGSYNDLGDKPTIPEAYDDTALAARVTAVEDGKANTADLATVATSGSYNDLSDKPTIPAEVTVDAAMSDASENPVQNKVVLAAIADAVDVVEANVYTKTETDAKIAEAMTDVDNEHFHVVTALPDPSVAKENHEYVLVTYVEDEQGQPTTTIDTEVHYLFYDGVFHQRTTQISLEGYATETYVDTATGALDTRVTAVEEALNLTALTDEEIAALVP